jgi:hypothetical protein
MGGGCDVIPAYHCWVIKETSKSKKKVQDACAFVDQLGMVGMSEEEFNKTYTATKYITNLKNNHPRLRFETWSYLNLVTIVGGRYPCVAGAPNDKDQIIKNKNAPRNARRLASLARRSTSASEPTNNSSGPSSGSRNDTSSPPNQWPAPEENMSTSKSKIVPLQEHLATCFKQLGIEAIVSIV